MRVTRALALGAAAAYICSLLPGVREHVGSATFWNVYVNATVFFASGMLCLLRAARTRVDRISWGCIGLGMVSYSAGTLIFYEFFANLDSPPIPSVADALWLTLYPLSIAAIGLMIKARVAGSAASAWLDGLVSGLGLVSLSAATVFPRVTAGASGPVPAVVTNFAYPVLDLALVATVVGGMATLGAWRQRSWILLGMGFLGFAGADSWYLLQVAAGSYQPGSPVDACYLVSAVLIGLASDERGGDGSTVVAAPAETRSFLVPGAFALVAVGTLVIGAWGGIPSLGIVLAVGALTAAWTRTALAVREVVQLSDSRRQARTDALTGLANRRVLYELIEAAEARSGSAADREPAPKATVILVDLDRFKEVNDALGHSVGDEILRAVSHRFEAQVPVNGTLARLGGDELALFVPELAPGEGPVLAQRLLDTLRQPFVFEGTSVHLDASIGITSVEPTENVGRALAKADLAMYRAKAARSGWEVYDDERDGNAWDRLATVEALRAAVAEGGLTVDLQPIVTPSLRRVSGVEALVRWRHPTRGMIPPDVFLPLAETAGLMPALTRAVLGLALDETVALRRDGWEIPVSVNLSASDLVDVRLAEHVAHALAERDLPGAALRIEITESLLVDRGGRSDQFLSRLRGLGIDLAVDDYGTGYSCMAYLHDLPVSYLKIDRGFTNRVLDDERTAIIVASTISMAHGLQLKVVAEGVETTVQMEWLRAHGCDLVQGYLIGRPMPPDGLRAWLAENATPVVPVARVSR